MTITVTVKQQGLDTLTKSLAEVVALQKQIASTGRGLGGLGRGIGGAGAAARQASTNFRDFSRSIDGISPTTQTITQRLTALRLANTTLARSIGVPIERIQRLNGVLGTLTPTTARIVQRFATFRDAGSGVERTFRQLNEEFGITRDQFNELSATVGASEQTLASVAVAAGKVANAIGGIFAQGFRDFVAFDNALRRVQAVSGETEEGIAGLNAEIIEIGSNTQFTNVQVAAAAEALLRLGFSAQETEDALAGVIDASRASGESVANVGRIIAATVNQFEDLNASSSTAISDILVATANNSAVSIGGLGQALSFTGTVANDLNQNVEDTATLIGLLGDAGLPASRAGRNLATALERLRDAAAENSAEFQALGVELLDANGEIRPILDLVPELRTNLEELGDPLAEGALISSLFGTEGARAFRGILASTDEEIENLRRTITESAGAAAKAGETIAGGLGGSLDRLNSGLQTASQTIGATFEPVLISLVEGATALVSVFNNLPAPIQATVIGITGFVGVLAAAVSTIAAYGAATKLLRLEQLGLTVATIRTSAAITTETAAKALNLAVTGNLGAAIGRLIAVINAQTAAFFASAGGAKALLATLAPVAGALAAATVAFFVVREAASRFQDAGDEFREGITNVREELNKLRTDAEITEDALDGVSNERPIPTGPIDSAITAFNRFNGVLNNLVGLDEDFLEIPTDAEKRIADIEIALQESQEDVFALADAAQELRQALANGFEDSAEGAREYADTVRAAEAVQEILNNRLNDSRRQLGQLDAEALGTEEYTRLADAIKSTITQTEFQIETLDRQVEAARRVQLGLDGVEESQKLSTEEIEQLTEALKEQRDELRDLAEEEFRVSVEAETDTFREEQRQADRAFQKELQADERSFEQQLTAEKRQLEESIRQDQRAFADEEEQAERQLARDLQAQEKAFSDSQKRDEEAFNRTQQEARRQFEGELNELRRQGEEEISGLRQDVERTIQLEEAETDDERDELQARFDEEDRIAERRAELLEPVLAREAEIAEEIRLKEQAFQEAQRLEAVAFEDQQEQRRAAFEEQLQAVRDQGEDAIEARRLAFEESLAAREDELEQAQQLRRDAFEATLEQRRDAFRVSQEAAQEAFEERQRQREALFREQQRELDRQSAADIEAIQAGVNRANEIREILENTDIPSVERAQVVKEILESVQNPVLDDVPGFRQGGVTDGGIARVGEAGPEFAVFPKGTRVLNKQDSQRAVVEALRARQQSNITSRTTPVATPLRVPPPQILTGLTPNNARMEGLLSASVGAIDRMNLIEGKVYTEVNRLRRSQDRNTATLTRIQRKASGAGTDEAMRLLLGGVL